MIEKVNLKNFRKHKNKTLEFSFKKVLLYGDNATGKTSILEAIYYALTTRSFKTSNISELVRNDSEFFKVEIKYRNDFIKTIYTKDSKKIFVNENHIKKVSDYLGIYPVVVFSSFDFHLLNLTPLVRREYFNLEIAQTYKKYSASLIKYRKVLKQRNLILKNIKLENPDFTFLNVVSEQLITLSKTIIQTREEYINKLNEILENIPYFPEYKIKVLYEPDVLVSNLNKAFLKNYKKELEQRQTLHGVQKDEYKILLNNQDAKKIASNGQMQIILLKIKYAILEFLRINDKHPVLLIDDITNTLDEKNIEKVFNTLPEDIQVIISSVTNLNNNNFTKIKIE